MQPQRVGGYARSERRMRPNPSLEAPPTGCALGPRGGRCLSFASRPKRSATGVASAQALSVMSKPHVALSVEHAPVERADLLGDLLRECLIELGASTDYPYLPLYWKEVDREPYLFFVDGRVTGFALVRELESSVREMAEFWVASAHRRLGVGRAAARALFQAHPGEWLVSSYPGSADAEMFWRNVIPEEGRSRGGASESVYRFVATDSMSVERTAYGVRSPSR